MKTLIICFLVTCLLFLSSHKTTSPQIETKVIVIENDHPNRKVDVYKLRDIILREAKGGYHLINAIGLNSGGDWGTTDVMLTFQRKQ